MNDLWSHQKTTVWRLLATLAKWFLGVANYFVQGLTSRTKYDVEAATEDVLASETTN